VTHPSDTYTRWLRAQHSPAHSRRTAARNAAFLLPHLRPGMRLLDVGCGPGSITIGLATAVAPGEAVGIDANADSVAAATQLAADRECPNARFVVGDAYALLYGGDEFDAVFMHAILQHLHEPAAALGEAYRVLRPGGPVAVADADYGGHLIAPRTPELDAAIALQERIRLRSGGNTRVGARLGVLLAEAGFERIDASATANSTGTTESALLVAEFNANYLAAPGLGDHATAAGWATHAALTAASQAWREWGRAPGAFEAMFWCHAVGWKPG
jgi:SAM-dependent methyltransferase